MRSMIEQGRAALVATLVLTGVCGIGFPLAVWGFAQLFPDQAHGSLVKEEGIPRGSRLIGQTFTSPRYFHSRPSAAGKGYDATSSGGSNLPPASPTLRELIETRAKDYRSVNALASGVPVPTDALTASASGLDPDITPENAAAQVARVARTRGMAPALLGELVVAHTEPPTLGVIGQPRVNVLMLNLALDKARPMARLPPAGTPAAATVGTGP
jgi:K+-transporting ATPase ATPase C chain